MNLSSIIQQVGIYKTPSTIRYVLFIFNFQYDFVSNTNLKYHSYLSFGIGWNMEGTVQKNVYRNPVCFPLIFSIF